MSTWGIICTRVRYSRSGESGAGLAGRKDSQRRQPVNWSWPRGWARIRLTPAAASQWCEVRQRAYPHRVREEVPDRPFGRSRGPSARGGGKGSNLRLFHEGSSDRRRQDCDARARDGTDRQWRPAVGVGDGQSRSTTASHSRTPQRANRFLRPTYDVFADLWRRTCGRTVGQLCWELGRGPGPARFPGPTSSGRRGEPLASDPGTPTGSVVDLSDCQDLVDGEVSMLEGERAGGEVEQPRARPGRADELLRLLP